jgi:hypothetical protein
MRPSEALLAVLNDGADPSSAPQEWLSFIVYQQACHVLDGQTLDARRSRLGAIPQNIRPLVEARAREIFSKRKD